MPRKHTPPKNLMPRTARPGRRTTVPVKSSIEADRLPRQPKLRKTPPRAAPPSKGSGKVPTHDGLKRSATKLREARERISAEVVEEARATGMLPHEWLLAVMRGEQINHFAYDVESQEIIEVIVLPTFSDRMVAAQAAAPYFATKLKPKEGSGGFADPAKRAGVMEVPLVDSMQKWAEVAAESQRVLKKKVTD
jgi:hypothetical protein